jgi:hypothetical protein
MVRHQGIGDSSWSLARRAIVVGSAASVYIDAWPCRAVVPEKGGSVKNFIVIWTLFCATCLGVGVYFNMSSSGVGYSTAASSRLAVGDSTLPHDGLFEMGERMWIKQSANLGMILIMVTIWLSVLVFGALTAHQGEEVGG